MGTFVRERNRIHAYCPKLVGERICGGHREVHLRGSRRYDDAGLVEEVRAMARRLFAVSCAACRTPCGGSGLQLSSTIVMPRGCFPATWVVKATFVLMRLTPVMTKKERRDGR